MLVLTDGFKLDDRGVAMSSFTHIDDQGRVRMVDVTEKKPTVRKAVAGGSVFMMPETFQLIKDQKVKKGNVLETARIAGVMAVAREAAGGRNLS